MLLWVMNLGFAGGESATQTEQRYGPMGPLNPSGLPMVASIGFVEGEEVAEQVEETKEEKEVKEKASWKLAPPLDLSAANELLDSLERIRSIAKSVDEDRISGIPVPVVLMMVG